MEIVKRIEEQPVVIKGRPTPEHERLYQFVKAGGKAGVSYTSLKLHPDFSEARWSILTKAGWVVHGERRRMPPKNRLVFSWIALDVPQPRTVESNLATYKRELRHMSALARKALKSGLAFQMGLALRQIEENLVKLTAGLTASALGMGGNGKPRRGGGRKAK